MMRPFASRILFCYYYTYFGPPLAMIGSYKGSKSEERDTHVPIIIPIQKLA